MRLFFCEIITLNRLQDMASTSAPSDTAFALAAERYAALGVDVDHALKTLAGIPISVSYTHLTLPTIYSV